MCDKKNSAEHVKLKECGAMQEGDPEHDENDCLHSDDVYQQLYHRLGHELDIEENVYQQLAQRKFSSEQDDEQLDGEMEQEEEAEDVYQRLAQKEQDLVLAAELGKALLEKNAELQRANTTMAEDFAQKLEDMEQEKYSLHMQISQQRIHYENTIKDLHDDMNALQERLNDHDNQTSSGQRQHIQAVNQLRQHNDALSEQLQQSLTLKEMLTVEVQQLRDQVKSRRTYLDKRLDHVGDLEHEVELLHQRNLDLECQLGHVRSENETLATELEVTQEQLLVLEKQRRELELQVRNLHTEIQELRDANTLLQAEVDHLSNCSHGNDSTSQTLFSELSHLSDPGLIGQISPIQGSNSDRFSNLSAEMLDEDDFEYDDDIFINASATASAYLSVYDDDPLYKPSDLYTSQHHNFDISDSHMIAEATVRTSDKNEKNEKIIPQTNEERNAESMTEYLQPRQKLTLTTELQALVREMAQNPDNENAEHYGCNTEEEEDREQDWEISDIGQELALSCKRLSDIHQQIHHHQNIEFSDEALVKRLKDYQSRVMELQQERDSLLDGSLQPILTPEAALSQVRKERDDALDRVHHLEIELSHSRTDAATLNAQLMFAIHQKVSLSQELDQWQIDLSELLRAQMQRRITEQHHAEEAIGMLENQVKVTKEKAEGRFFKLKKN